MNWFNFKYNYLQFDLNRNLFRRLCNRRCLPKTLRQSDDDPRHLYWPGRKKCVKTGLSGRIRLNYRPFNCCYFCQLRLIFPVYGVRSSWHCETNERYHKPFILKVCKLNLIIIIIIITLKYTNFPESWRSIGNQI